MQGYTKRAGATALRAVCAVMMLGVGASGSALAQEDDGLGLRAGAFMINPQLRVATAYDDNIYATKNNRESALITTVSPSVNVASNWSRHSLVLDVGATGGVYTGHSKENYVTGRVGLNGRLDVLRETYLEGHMSVDRRVEFRGDPDVPAANDEPSYYYQYRTGVTAYRGVSRLSIRTGVDFTRNDYQSVEVTGGGSRSQAERDFNTYEAHARVGYELLPNVIPYVQASYNVRQYDTKTPVNRDSQGYRIGVGTGFDAGGIITGSVHAGYLEQRYESNRQSDASGLWFGGRVNWEVTRLTNVELGFDRTVKETQAANASGYTQSAFQLRIDHELLRNLMIGASGDVFYNEYNGRDITDTYYRAGPRVTYLWNRYLSAELSATHLSKTSNRSAREYRSNQVMFSITGKL